MIVRPWYRTSSSCEEPWTGPLSHRNDLTLTHSITITSAKEIRKYHGSPRRKGRKSHANWGDDELKTYGEKILYALDVPHNAFIVNYCKSQSLRMWSVLYSSAFVYLCDGIISISCLFSCTVGYPLKCSMFSKWLCIMIHLDCVNIGDMLH